MCARFTLTVADYGDLVRTLQARMDPEAAALYKPRYNIAPTEMQWILHTDPRDERVLSHARWGLTNHWHASLKDGVRQINARRETAATLRSFKEAYHRRRCIVPADGFLEWTGPKKKRLPIWFHRPAGGLLLMAGLYEHYKDRQAGLVQTFTILTTDAIGEVAAVHDRMPVVLPPEALDTWFSAQPGQVSALLDNLGDPGLVGKRVSRRVNKAGVDEPSVLGPPDGDEDESADPQGSLF